MKPTVREQMIAKGIHMRKSKEIKDMLVSETKVPNWVVEGMRCVVKAPSSRNRQPVMFYYSSGSVMAKVKEEEFFDLGIAKLHFEIGAGQESGTLEMVVFFSTSLWNWTGSPNRLVFKTLHGGGNPASSFYHL